MLPSSSQANSADVAESNTKIPCDRRQLFSRLSALANLHNFFVGQYYRWRVFSHLLWRSTAIFHIAQVVSLGALSQMVGIHAFWAITRTMKAQKSRTNPPSKFEFEREPRCPNQFPLKLERSIAIGEFSRRPQPATVPDRLLVGWILVNLRPESFKNLFANIHASLSAACTAFGSGSVGLRGPFRSAFIISRAATT